MKDGPLKKMLDRVYNLMTDKYSGNIYITIRLHQGGIIQLLVNEEYPIKVGEKSLDNGPVK